MFENLTWLDIISAGIIAYVVVSMLAAYKSYKISTIVVREAAEILPKDWKDADNVDWVAVLSKFITIFKNTKYDPIAKKFTESIDILKVDDQNNPYIKNAILEHRDEIIKQLLMMNVIEYKKVGSGHRVRVNNTFLTKEVE